MTAPSEMKPSLLFCATGAGLLPRPYAGGWVPQFAYVQNRKPHLCELSTGSLDSGLSGVEGDGHIRGDGELDFLEDLEHCGMM